MTSCSTDRPLRVVAIGGGTGLSTLLRGLKHYTKPLGPKSKDAPQAPCCIQQLTAVVTVTDDGGSSGRLRRDLRMLPPGDVRNCIAALSEDESLLSHLFQFRFPEAEDGQDTGLAGHSFGNLFLAALTHITGDFSQAVQMSSQVLAARGQIFPATNTDVHLSAVMDDGTVVEGETNITASTKIIRELHMHPADAPPMQQTLRAIAEADLITLGPGSLYTSLITNLLVRGIPEALAASRATRVYICNLMTQANESLGLTASQHLSRIQDHAGDRIFDYALINDAPLSPELVERYAREGQSPIAPDIDAIRSLGIVPVTGSFAHEGEKLRHDYDRLAESLIELGQRGRPRHSP
ncbi:gluconeogenesis factor YvcK family protein [Terriglobus aquaticus]|uniref:Putative gluconeogenesis factor n=1 Tax=Terriglobus aquaticus TaxID=940139 RepID=A0ABW9KM85_9BACT|nr:gluconeogenesis factor YvcK family protein [Terriglobus aquaticus]